MTEVSNTESNLITPAAERLKAIPYSEVKPLLDAKHEADPVAGIAIANLTDIEPVETDKGIYHFHAARVFTSTPETPNFVNPHYHKIGEEPYNILRSDGGEMNLGYVKDGKVEWDAPRTVVAGEIINVKEGQVHSLRNIGQEPLDFTFACPDNHLIDNSPEKPEGDRYLTKNLPSGIPPQYPK
ncbi:MAG: hypothetical protein AAB675_03890 [Patescibacteria group bacterium]